MSEKIIFCLKELQKFWNPIYVCGTIGWRITNTHLSAIRWIWILGNIWSQPIRKGFCCTGITSSLTGSTGWSDSLIQYGTLMLLIYVVDFICIDNWYPLLLPSESSLVHTLRPVTRPRPGGVTRPNINCSFYTYWFLMIHSFQIAFQTTSLPVVGWRQAMRDRMVLPLTKIPLLRQISTLRNLPILMSKQRKKKPKVVGMNLKTSIPSTDSQPSQRNHLEALQEGQQLQLSPLLQDHALPLQRRCRKDCVPLLRPPQGVRPGKD